MALTKADLVDRDILELVRLEVEEFVAGRFLESAPVVAVSAVTGAGLDDLRRELERAARAAPPRGVTGHFRLPLDRAFTVKGFGTVVTGTLISGSVAREQEVELYPTGRRLRVRGVQVYGQPADRAIGGQRTALNLADIEPSEVARGMVLAAPGIFQTVTQIDCELQLLPSAKPLKHRAPVHFHAGTAEMEAQVRLLDGSPALRPGQRTWARIVLREPALLLPGDRFIIRMFSPVVTIGGGVVLDTGGKRYRKTDHPGVSERLRVLAEAPAAERIALLVREAKYGMGMAGLVARTGLTEARNRDGGGGSARGGLSNRMPGLRIVPGSMRPARSCWPRCASFTARIRCFPVFPNKICAAANCRIRPHSLMDAILAQEKQMVVEGENVRLASHKVVLKQDEEQARSAIEGAFEQAGLAVPGLPDVLAKSGVEAARARSLCRSCCAKSVWCASAKTWFSTAPPWRNCVSCLPPTSPRASTWVRSRIGPASPVNTPSRCWNTWIANA